MKELLRSELCVCEKDEGMRMKESARGSIFTETALDQLFFCKRESWKKLYNMWVLCV